MKNCIILGNRSDIAVGLESFLLSDGWTITGWNREGWNNTIPKWDLVICALGSVKPVGFWMSITDEEWESSIRSNLLLPLNLLKTIWHQRNKGSKVCFMAGNNPNKTEPFFTPYAVAKTALLKAVEHLDSETPDTVFFSLGPGVVRTKIHPVMPSEDRGSTPIEKIYACLKWCVEQPKEVIGGRNICVSDPWEAKELSELLEKTPSLFKLRRVG